MKLEKKLEILNELVEIINNSIVYDFNTAECKFSVDGASVRQIFSYEKGGTVEYSLLDDPNRRVLALILELQKLMCEDSGGKWNECTISLEKDGKAKTNFNDYNKISS